MAFILFLLSNKQYLIVFEIISVNFFCYFNLLLKINFEYRTLLLLYSIFTIHRNPANKR